MQSWLQLGITLGSVIVLIIISWAKFDKRIALLSHELRDLRDNHIHEIKCSLNSIVEEQNKTHDALLRLEERLKVKNII